jgi:putative transposase
MQTESSNYREGFMYRFFGDEEPVTFMLRKISSSGFRMVNIIDPEDVREFSEEELDYLKSNGDLQGLVEADGHGEISFYSLPKNDQVAISRKLAYVKNCYSNDLPIRSHPKVKHLIDIVADRIGDKKKPGSSAVISWVNAFEAGHRRVMSLHHSKCNSGRKSEERSPKFYAFVEDAKKIFMRKSKPNITSAIRYVENCIVKYNLTNPEAPLKEQSYNTIKYHINKSSAYEIAKARNGSSKAATEFAYEYEFEKPTMILERVEIDHTLLNIHVVNEFNGKPIGRPNLTLIIDYFSSMILGYLISFEPPGYVSAGIAMKNAMLRKVNLPPGFEWPAHGKPMLLVADNGAEFWGTDFDMLCQSVGITVQYAPVRRPNYKAKVERTFRTIDSEVIDILPGRVLPPEKRTAEYNPESDACLTLRELDACIQNWIVNVYHRTPRGDSRYTPLEKWMQSESYLPIPMEDEIELSIHLLPFKRRVLDRAGIQLEKLTYKSLLLTDLYRREGSINVEIKYNPFDLGRVYVLDERNRKYIPVQCKNFEYANGLSLYMHKLIRKDQLTETNERVNEDIQLQEGKARMVDFINEAHSRTSGKKSQKAKKRLARATAQGIYDLFDESAKDLVVVEVDGDLELASSIDGFNVGEQEAIPEFENEEVEEWGVL